MTNLIHTSCHWCLQFGRRSWLDVFIYCCFDWVRGEFWQLVVNYWWDFNERFFSLMKNRRPFELKTFLAVYNILQVFACLYFLVNVFRTGYQVNFLWKCYMTGFDNLSHVKLLYFCYLVKGIELIETICFVLRKKFKQMSFLHVYHHVSTFIFAYFGVTRVGSENKGFGLSQSI